MNDRELLELAAKAAGIEPASYMGRDVGWYVPGRGVGNWNPLTDDGDALRLALSLNILVGLGKAWTNGDQLLGVMYGEDLLQGQRKATRRAIVRAAAEIGKAMQ